LSKSKRLVIIGNSAAGLSAVKTIREKGCSCPVTMVSAEECNAYSPVLLTYYLAGKIQRESMFITNEKFYQDYGVKTIFGKRAVGIDVSRQVVQLEDSREIEYDSLLIATGSSPRMPGNIDDKAGEYIAGLRSIEDADRIIKFCTTGKEVIVIGAGLISLQIISALAGKGAKFTVIDILAQILSQNMDSDCAAIVERRIREEKQVKFLLGESINKIQRKNGGIFVALDSGKELTAGGVIVGIGVVPNINWLKDSSILLNKGILVDDHLRTNFEEIYAAGDVCESKNIITKNPGVIPNWYNACEQGRIAALNMLGYKEKYAGALNGNITGIFGLIIATVGLSKLPDEVSEELKIVDPARGIFRKFIIREDKLLGATLMGTKNDIEDIGIIRNLVENSRDISQFKDYLANFKLNTGRLYFFN